MTLIGAHSSMTDRSYEAVKGWILTLELAPGQRVTEDQVLGMLGGGISKTPVRDALRWLVREGFVHKVGRGYRVAPITIRTTRDLYAFRTVLETAAIRRLLSRRHEVEQLAAYQSSAALAYNPPDPDSVRQYLCGSDDFHLALAKAAGSPSLTQALALTLEKLQPALHLMLRSVPPDWLASCEHHELAAVIVAGDCDRAVHAVEDHLRTAEQLVLEVLLNLDGEVQLPAAIVGASPATPLKSAR